MKLQNHEEEKGSSLQGSLRERAVVSKKRRQKQLRTRLILLNSAVALVVIMVVLVFKLVSLNDQDSLAGAKNKKQAEQKAESVKQKKEPQKTQQKESKPVIQQTEPVTGADKWIRKDLDKEKPMIALTFDDGPYTPTTKRILNALKKVDGAATFFWVGNRVKDHERVVKQAYNQGCQIASHTYEHKYLTKLKVKKIRQQISKTDLAFKKVIGTKSTALRPPGGFVNSKVCKTVEVPMICWSVDSEDWKSRKASAVVRSCKKVKDGDIVLMHDLYSSTAEAVERLAPYFKKKGFQLVTVDELFYYKGVKAKAGKVYHKLP